MFTIEQINALHPQSASGDSFPKYVNDIKALGIAAYDVYVVDGHTDYRGKDNESLSSSPLWLEKEIARPASPAKLEHTIKIHQLGKTDYQTFCQQAADSGVAKWTVDTEKMTCIYFDSDGTIIIEEAIPAPF
jgi:uncharacterized protein YbcV (DUF1398 family)